ncbi:MAG TPA: (d)CMP kinase [Gemmatimonadota bacterium]|nr:(d)CMP kinase [Gemmatimonadota bacterium]
MASGSRIIAIDGPAGTGKSTTAREVASRLGWRYVDSGAFYRVAALLALRHDLDLTVPADRGRLREALEAADVGQEVVGGTSHVRLEGEDVTVEIRTPAVTAIVSRVADDPDLREIVNVGLRGQVGKEPAVIDGRDIGTVVFPDAFLKVFLLASLEERARRRVAEAEPGREDDPTVLASYAQSLAERDRRDRERSVAPLRPADDALYLDTSGLDFDTQVARVVRAARERLRMDA